MNRLLQLGHFNRSGMCAGNEGRTADALFQLAQAESVAQTMESPLHGAKVRNNMGLVYLMAGHFDEALTCFRKAEELAVSGAGEGNVLHRAVLRNIARLEEAKTGKAA